MTAILGLSAFYHDSAAALVVDGQIVAAAAEERFSRRKHDSSFPAQAISYCLNEAQLRPDQLDQVGFYEKPLLKFDRLLESYLAFAPRGYRSFRQAMPSWLTTKLRLTREIQRGLDHVYRKRIVCCTHHQSHAASAFYPSPFEKAAILTVDGVGEWSTAAIHVGQGNRLMPLEELRFPHSLGLLYSAFTAFCGFQVNDGEYKLMGLASYGRPVYRDLILRELMDLKADGSFRLDMRYFNYCHGLTMTSPQFARLLGVEPRRPGAELTPQHQDLAASIQAATEEIMLRMARHVHQTTGSENLVLAGGVALNAVANGRLLVEGPFERIWVQPAAGDDGGALGVALLIWHELLRRERVPQTEGDDQHGSLLGPSFDDRAIRQMLDERGAAYDTAADDQQLCDATASLLAEHKVVGWFQGRMEYGPRALGCRSILADPRDPTMQARLNATVKNRESFRPFAPAVLSEKASEHFQIAAGESFPYMLIVAPCTAAKELPAIAHVDGSARLQMVDSVRFPLFHQLLRSFDRLTGCPVLVNTSFNLQAEPIVCAPEDAYQSFLRTNLDALVIGRQIVRQRAGEEQDRLPADSVRSREQARWLSLEIPWRPSSRQLRRFVLSLAVAMPLLALILRLPGMMLVGAVCLSLVFYFGTFRFPAVALAVYRILLVMILPFVLLLSEVLLAAIYYLVLTPLGLALRLWGHDALALQLELGRGSYWQVSLSPPDPRRYYRQS